MQLVLAFAQERKKVSHELLECWPLRALARTFLLDVVTTYAEWNAKLKDQLTTTRTLLPRLTQRAGSEGNKARGYYDMAHAES
jgi:hypothetical protein